MNAASFSILHGIGKVVVSFNDVGHSSGGADFITGGVVISTSNCIIAKRPQQLERQRR